jgi:SAM-dependent methyltransferase
MLNSSIDWVQLREDIILSFKRLELYDPTYWNNEANSISEDLVHWSELTKKQLNQLPLSSEITVLDVGAGTGRMTLPIAKQVRHVTALEPSKRMLSILQENARTRQVFNISCINQTLELLEINCSYDLVVASFSLFMFDIKTALLKMNSLASRGVFLFLSASPWVDTELQKALYGTANLWSDFVFIYNILHDAGIIANVEVSDYELKKEFTDLETALSVYSHTYRVPIEKQGILQKYLKENLVEDQGKLWFNRKRKMATIWWTTNK